MNYQSASITRTAEITHTDVRHVMWKIKSDMYQLRIFHSVFDAEYEEKLSQDLFQWTYRGYVDKIEFQFYNPSNYNASFVLLYTIHRGQVIGSSDDAGNIPYLDLTGKSFRVLIIRSPAWWALSDQGRAAFGRDLNWSWGTSEFDLKYGSGSWTQDKNYSSNSFGAGRSIYKA
jgi:hypothetical protein